VSWQRQLHGIISYPRKSEVAKFLQETATPALEDVVAELRKRSLDAEIHHDDNRLKMIVTPGGEEEFSYGIRIRPYDMPSYSFIESQANRQSADKYYRAEVFLSDGGQDYDVMGLTREELIQDVLAQYDRHFQYLHAVRA
jgi:choline/glycine/proline betaine transport protein